MFIAFAKTLARAGERNRLFVTSGALCAALAMTGCYGIPTSGEPSRLLTVEDELPPLTANNSAGYDDIVRYWFDRYVDTAKVGGNGKAMQLYRNEFMTAQMSTIDMAYTQYETRLTNEVEESGFAAKATSMGLTTAASLVPVQHTGQLLSGIATVVTGTDAAFNEKILITKTVQNVQTQMRKDRHDQKAVIIANMKCNVLEYPLGMALADLELYRRAGTFSSGLIGVTNTVNTAETKSKDNQNAQRPGGDANTATTGGNSPPPPAGQNGNQNGNKCITLSPQGLDEVRALQRRVNKLETNQPGQTR